MRKIFFFSTQSPSFLWLLLVVTVYAFTPTSCRRPSNNFINPTAQWLLGRNSNNKNNALITAEQQAHVDVAAHQQKKASAEASTVDSSLSHSLTDLYPAIVTSTTSDNDDNTKKKNKNSKNVIEVQEDPLEIYREKHAASIADPVSFWKEQAHQFINWDQDFTNVMSGSLRDGDISWFTGGKLNICYNAVDRHVYHSNQRANKIALLWEGDESNQIRKITYRQLLIRVSQIANALKSQGVKKGNVVTIYMPMIPELCMTMLACARIGAVHSVIFAGFSSEAVATRVLSSQSKIIITCNIGKRGGKHIPLLQIIKDAMNKILHSSSSSGDDNNEHAVVHKILVWDHAVCSQSDETNTTATATTMMTTLSNEPEEKQQEVSKDSNNNNNSLLCNDDTNKIQFIDMNTLVNSQRPYCPPESMDSEDHLFILYTSGSTGQPKGLVHTTGGYAVYAAFTTKTTFNLQNHNDNNDNDNNEVFACVADCGWITGHTYITYGPLLNACTTLLFESTPIYPHPGRYWEMIDKHQITHFYTAPTSIRLLMKFGSEIPHQYNLSSLKVLGSVGEPINPAAWKWYYEHVGRNTCTVVDTYWQTETGGHMATNLPGITPMLPGSCTLPLYGIDFAVLNPVTGEEILPSDAPSPDDDHPGAQTGVLAIRQPWPGMARTCLNDHERFKTMYLDPYPGFYFTGDSVLRLRSNGYHFITGRVDDVLNVSGHRIGTAEVESALVLHPAVAQAAVVGKPHPIKGQAIVAFCMLTVDYLNQHESSSDNHDELIQELRNQVRKEIGPFASPDEIFIAPSFPVTRSGKIMRRILRKIVAGETDSLGDTSTLADPSIVNVLIEKVEAAAAAKVVDAE